MMTGNETILKEQSLERKVSDVKRIGFSFDVDKEALKQEYRILKEETNYSINSSVYCPTDRLSYKNGTGMNMNDSVDDLELKCVMDICLISLMIAIFDVLYKARKGISVDDKAIEPVGMGEENSSDCLERETKGIYFIVMRKKELRLRKGRLINRNNITYINQLDEQSTGNIIPFSIIGSKFPRPNMFYNIDQRQEHVGIEASSS
jgi:hypothetical protein